MTTKQSISYTPEGAVSVSYTTLLSAPGSLNESIERAFGSDPECLGIIIVRDLPPIYTAYRQRLLTLASCIQIRQARRKCQRAIHRCLQQLQLWMVSRQEIMNGKPDVLKGSYYANPVTDSPSASISAQHITDWPEYYAQNIWPNPNEKSVEDFEEAFKDLGRFVLDVGCALAAACQPFALSRFSDTSMSLPKLISTSQTTKARLLHYFPPSQNNPSPAEDEPVDSWCGFHLDHSLLTGLTSAMYLSEDDDDFSEPTVVQSPSESSGLYIRTRGGELTKVSIPEDSLAFQTGEALEIATGGKLRATPHCVRVGSGVVNSSKISRETFALFMQPDTDQSLSSSVTFGQFSRGVFDEHYEKDFE